MDTALTQIIRTWQDLYDKATDPQAKAQYGQILKAHKDHPGAGGEIADSTPTVETEIDGEKKTTELIGNGGPPETGPDNGTGGPMELFGDGDTTLPDTGKKKTPEPVVDGGKDETGGVRDPLNPLGSGRTNSKEAIELIEKYRTKLPPDMPAVFDLTVQGTGKTLRQIIEDAAEKTGTPAILLAAQAWQETKAGLHGNPEMTAKYGKTGGTRDGELSATVDTATINPGNGGSDIGIVQINPDTLKTIIYGGQMGQGELAVQMPPHPELAGLRSENVEDAFVLAGTHMRDMYEIFKEKGYGSSDTENWLYAGRGYVGGPGAIVPGNLYVNGVGGGDPTYVGKIQDHIYDFAYGNDPFWPAGE